jgi:hypothetical protein
MGENLDFSDMGDIETPNVEKTVDELLEELKDAFAIIPKHESCINGFNDLYRHLKTAYHKERDFLKTAFARMDLLLTN